jgi:hypothetical protein
MGFRRLERLEVVPRTTIFGHQILGYQDKVLKHLHPKTVVME